MTSLRHLDGHEKATTKNLNGGKPNRENTFTKIIRNIRTLCNVICCCPCGVELPAAPPFRPVRRPVQQAGKSKATAAPVAVSFSEIYSRCMMVHGQGYPLYNPEPDPSLSLNNRKTGIRIGDVGLLTPDGSFNFLFNVCSQYQHVNSPQLPDNFRTIDSDVAMVTHFPRGKHLFSHGVEQTTHSSGLNADTHLTDRPASYHCSGPAGAVLELPEGASLFGAQNGNAFRDLAARHAESWYKYMLTREQLASNGSLYLVTGSVKSDSWGVAVFNKPSNSEDYLRFIVDEAPTHNTPQSRYKWEQSGSAISKVGPSKPSSNKEGPDQCIFLRGFKIMLRQDRWDALAQSPAQQSSSPVFQFPSTGNGSGDGNVFLNTTTQGQSGRVGTTSRKFEYDSTIMGKGWTSPTSQLHPSDIVNTVLLKSVPDAKVALCHDVDWCKVLPKVFVESLTSLKMEELLDNISQSYEIEIENDCAYLVRTRK